jgi:hypothetical protein
MIGHLLVAAAALAASAPAGAPPWAAGGPTAIVLVGRYAEEQAQRDVERLHQWERDHPATSYPPVDCAVPRNQVSDACRNRLPGAPAR